MRVALEFFPATSPPKMVRGLLHSLLSCQGEDREEHKFALLISKALGCQRTGTDNDLVINPQGDLPNN
jgi:hypothetical protein